MKLFYDPRLLEEAVTQAAQGPRREEYQRQREEVYALPLEERPRAFARCHQELFQRWGLDAPLVQVLAEFPRLQAEIEESWVGWAPTSHEEAGELGQGRKKMGVRVLPARFVDPGALKAFLRHELMHLEDMLDPAFSYQESLEEDNPTRERYRVLWDTSIEARLEKAGRATAGAGERLQREFLALFPAGAAGRQAFDSLWASPPRTHRDLLELARHPERAVAGGEGTAPRLCPVCTFPTPQRIYSFPAPIATLVARDLPSWKPQEGLCPRCLEVYEVRAGLW